MSARTRLPPQQGQAAKVLAEHDILVKVDMGTGDASARHGLTYVKISRNRTWNSQSPAAAPHGGSLKASLFGGASRVAMTEGVRLGVKNECRSKRAGGKESMKTKWPSCFRRRPLTSRNTMARPWSSNTAATPMINETLKNAVMNDLVTLTLGCGWCWCTPGGHDLSTSAEKSAWRAISTVCVTDDATMEIVQQVLVVNSRPCGCAAAAGLCGMDDHPAAPSWTPLNWADRPCGYPDLYPAGRRLSPVINGGHGRSGQAYNVNADTAAAQCYCPQAEKLVSMTIS